MNNMNKIKTLAAVLAVTILRRLRKSKTDNKHIAGKTRTTVSPVKKDIHHNPPPAKQIKRIEYKYFFKTVAFFHKEKPYKSSALFKISEKSHTTAITKNNPNIVKNCIAVVVLVVLTMGSSPFEFNGKTYVK